MIIDEVISTMLNGEPIHDGIIIGTIFICFYVFYSSVFGAVFNFFKK